MDSLRLIIKEFIKLVFIDCYILQILHIMDCQKYWHIK